jgi:succinoglycan biosynthesis transport protein ExoP
MRKGIEALRQEVLDLQKRSIQYNILKREVDTNRELHASLLQRFKEVDVASGVGANNVFVVDRAQIPGAPSSPGLMHALLMALALGLGAGFGAAYLLERLDDKIRTVEQAEQVAGMSTLGIIPRASDVKEELADPRSALCESYRSLCTALQFSTENGLPKSLAVTSSGPSEGKSLMSLNVAKHFASLGRKVLLVDGDLRNPSLHTTLNADNSVGFSNYLTGACAPPDAMQKTDVANLAFIPSGPLSPNAAELLGGRASCLCCRPARRCLISSSSTGLRCWGLPTRNSCRVPRGAPCSSSRPVRHERRIFAAPCGGFGCHAARCLASC